MYSTRYVCIYNIHKGMYDSDRVEVDISWFENKYTHDI